MADIEKAPEHNVATTQTNSSDNARVEEMSGWIYKRWKIGPWTTSYYASPLTQTLIMSFALFLLPGMSNALYAVSLPCQSRSEGMSSGDSTHIGCIQLTT